MIEVPSAGEAPDRHAGGPGGGDAVDAVLDGQGPGRIDAQPVGGMQEDVRVRLAVRDPVGRVDVRIKKAVEADLGQLAEQGLLVGTAGHGPGQADGLDGGVGAEHALKALVTDDARAGADRAQEVFRKGLAEMLLKLMPPMVIADLGAGEGTFSQLLAQRAEKVIAVDNSEKMVEFGADLALRNGFTNLEYRHGDLEALSIETGSVDLAFLSQSLHHAAHPKRAIAEAYRILKPGGRIAVLDLVKHHFEEARELYADLWLGFAEVELVGHMRAAGFVEIESALVHKEEQAPFFETVLVLGRSIEQ